MLTGRGVDGRRAKKLGLVDAVTPKRHFANAVRQFLMNPPPPHKPAFTAAITDWPVRAQHRRRDVGEEGRRSSARRDHYPAPYAIIELWRDFGGDVRNVPREHPASMQSLFKHPTTREPDPHLQAAGPPEGAGQGGRCRRCGTCT